MSLCFPDLRQPRARGFFWLGVSILPVFWVWWMTARNFSRGQRLAGGAWTATWLGLIAFEYSSWSSFLPFLKLGYPIVALVITSFLVAWLLFRFVEFTFIEMVMIPLVFGREMINQYVPTVSAVAAAQPGLLILLLPLMAAFLHVVLSSDWGGVKRARCSGDA